MKKLKLVLNHTDLRVLLGLGPNVEIMFVESVADPVTVAVHLLSPDFPDQDMNRSGWRDAETNVIKAAELADYVNLNTVTYVFKDGTAQTGPLNLVDGLDGLKHRQPVREEFQESLKNLGTEIRQALDSD